CIWDRNSIRGERQHQQMDIAIRLKKPFILAIEKGAAFPDFIREEANIVYEFEWDVYHIDELGAKLKAFIDKEQREV
ncbi:unnamed protein product, partial [marine sediment metagenome]